MTEKTFEISPPTGPMGGLSSVDVVLKNGARYSPSTSKRPFEGLEEMIQGICPSDACEASTEEQQFRLKVVCPNIDCEGL